MGLKHIKGLIYFWKKYKKEGLLWKKLLF
jgi:hypothetical protein